MVQVNVTVDDAHLSTISRVADALKERGMDVAEVLTELGVITGAVPQLRQSALMEVDGVISVDADQPVQLPPPDSPVQ